MKIRHKLITASIISILYTPITHADAIDWFQQGANSVMKKAQQQVNTKKAKNVILFIGDGMGVSTVTAARILAGQQQGHTGEENFLSFEKLPNVGLAKTYNTNQQTPDSAGTMTAMMSGVKSKAGVIGVNQDVIRADCASSKNTGVETFLEQAEKSGKATGVVSTARITHATPAATYAHSSERNWEDDKDMPKEARELGCKDIASQLIDFAYGDGIDVAMGGGRRSFIPKTMTDPENDKKKGERQDGRNLTKEFSDKGDNYYYVWNQKGFDALPNNKDTKVLGLFNHSHMQYEADRAEDKAGEPSLSQMTKKAIDILKQNDNGFFLMVEAGRIDHGHHAGNAYRALTDTVEYANAVKAALDNVNLDDTLIIVTADHSHVFTMAGYPTRGNPILGKVISNDKHGNPQKTYAKDELGKPYTTLGYANGAGYTGASVAQAEGSKTFPHYEKHPEYKGITSGRPDLTNVDTTAKNYMQEATIPFKSETHAGEDVAIYAQGPYAHLLNGVVEQNEIYHVMNVATHPELLNRK